MARRSGHACKGRHHIEFSFFDLDLCYVVCGGYSGVIDGCAFHKPAPVTDAIGIDVSVMGHDTLFYLVEGR